MEAKRTQACSREAIERFFRNEVGPMMEKHKFKPQNMWNLMKLCWDIRLASGVWW